MDSEEVLTEKYKWWFLSFNKSSQYWQLRQVCREGIALEKTNSIFEIYTNGKWSNQSKSLIWASFPFLLYFQDWESDKFYEVRCNDTIVLILCSWWRLNLCIKPQYKKNVIVLFAEIGILFWWLYIVETLNWGGHLWFKQVSFMSSQGHLLHSYNKEEKLWHSLSVTLYNKK